MVELVYVISKLMHNLLALVGKFTFGSCWLFFKVKVLFAFEILFLEKIDNFSTEQESGPILRCMCLTFNSSSIINLHITNRNQDSIHMCTRKVPLKWMTIVQTFMMNESYLPENVCLISSSNLHTELAFSPSSSYFSGVFVDTGAQHWRRHRDEPLQPHYDSAGARAGGVQVTSSPNIYFEKYFSNQSYEHERPHREPVQGRAPGVSSAQCGQVSSQ